MKVYLYKGGLSVVEKSGVGSAIHHQEKMLRMAGVSVTQSWAEADVVHINTVFPDSFLAACRARREKKKVIYYGHSTMEDFRNSFIGSNLAAPLFRKWICLCYSRGDVILTPTSYSRKLLIKYGIKKPIYPVTNGVDTDFFRADAGEGRRFREKYHISPDPKVVISAGRLIKRKGIFDFITLASQMPDTLFIWFGGGNDWAVPWDVKRLLRSKPDNVIFAGFVKQEELRQAYCGADAFAFFSYEETEGIVVLEALSCKIPIVLRDIPVYENWLEDGVQVYKASDVKEFRQKLENIFTGEGARMAAPERQLAEKHSLIRTGKRIMDIYRKETSGEIY